MDPGHRVRRKLRPPRRRTRRLQRGPRVLRLPHAHLTSHCRESHARETCSEVQSLVKCIQVCGPKEADMPEALGKVWPGDVVAPDGLQRRTLTPGGVEGLASGR